jgi:hypothetical protein
LSTSSLKEAGLEAEEGARLYQIVESFDLLLELQLQAVRAEKRRVLLLELLPHDAREGGVDVGLLFEPEQDLVL